MNDSVFLEAEFFILVIVSLILPIGIYAYMMWKKAISPARVMVLAVSLIALSGINVVLLQRLSELAKSSTSLVDDQIFSSEISFMLYLLPALFAGIGVNMMSHILMNHLTEAEQKYIKDLEEQAGHESELTHDMKEAAKAHMDSSWWNRASGAAGNPWGVLIHVDAFLAKLPVGGILALAFSIVTAIGLPDYLLGPDISLSIFYILPVGIATFYAGKKAGYGIAFLSGAPLLIEQFGSLSTHTGLLLWRLFLHIGTMCIVTLLLDRARIHSAI